MKKMREKCYIIAGEDEQLEERGCFNGPWKSTSISKRSIISSNGSHLFKETVR